jgi:hypothetical protein
MATIEELVEAASADMLSPEHNFNIAKEYETIGQTAAAMSFYLRTAEYGYETHPILVYNSLIRIAFCVEDQSGREHTLENSLLQAIQYIPTRPEAYFVLSRYYERNRKWQECYTFAELGLLHTNIIDSLPANVDYIGKNALFFEKAVSAWWLGRKEESKLMFNNLLEQDLPEEYKSTIRYNLGLMG